MKSFFNMSPVEQIHIPSNNTFFHHLTEITPIGKDGGGGTIVRGIVDARGQLWMLWNVFHLPMRGPTTPIKCNIVIVSIHNKE